jgi:Transglutaminase-like superfamily
MYRIKRAHDRRPLLLATAVLLVIAANLAPARAQKAAGVAPGEDWFVTRLQGQPVGYEHSAVTTEGQGDNTSVVTNDEQLMVIKRLGSEIKLKITVKYWESSSGQLLKLQSNTDMSAMTMTTEATVGKNEITVKSGTGGTNYEQKVPYSGELLGPNGVRMRSVASLKKTGDKLTFQTFVPDQTAVKKITRTVLGLESIDLARGKTDSIKVEEEMEDIPLKSTVWLSVDGETLRTVAAVPALGDIENVLTDKQTALAASSGSELSADVFKNAVARSNIRLPQPRSLDRLLLRLALKSKDLGWPSLADERQKVLDQNADAMTLEIRKVLPKGTAARPVAVAEANRVYLEPNSYLQSDDPEIKKIANDVVGKEPDAFKAAQALERWVYTNLTGKGFGVGFATASEVCKDRQGDCSEHAVFLAALARAAGIPSRVAMGLEYLEGIWGGHAWTEVLIGQEWIALDATLGLGYVDAAHLRIMASSMKDGMGKEVTKLAQLLGNVDIKVTEFDLAGKTTKVGDKAAPYTVNGITYENPWLGVTVVAPQGFTVGDLDAVYPDATVVGMKGPEGEIRLRQGQVMGGDSPDEAAKKMLTTAGLADKQTSETVSGKHAAVGSSSDAKGAVFINGSDLWLLSAKGKNAGTLFETVCRSFVLK